MASFFVHKDARRFPFLWNNRFLGIGKAFFEPRDYRVVFF